MPEAHSSRQRSHARFATRVALTFLLALSALPLWARSEPQVTTVTIQSYWAGYSPYTPLKTDLVIERLGMGYRMSGAISRHKFAKPEPVEVVPSQAVPVERVAALVAALRAPAQSVVGLKALGLNQPTLQRAIDRVWQEAELTKLRPPVRAQADALRESLRDSDMLAATITRGFNARHSDDFPYVAVKVEMSDGTTLSICSTSQQAFMLPWKDGNGVASYNTAIPDAIQVLLPRDAANRERLHGSIRDFQLDQMLEEGLTEQVGRLRAEDQAGPALRALDARFKVSNVAPMPPFEGGAVSGGRPAVARHTLQLGSFDTAGVAPRCSDCRPTRHRPDR